MISQKTSLLLLAFVALLLVVIGWFVGPIPQPPAYHDFADQRSWLGIANTANVLSNIPLALVGIGGLFLLLSKKVSFTDQRIRWPWLGVFVGLFLTAIGSSYYHLAPDNSRLVWDRLPLSVIFMSYVAALISERIDVRLGLRLWPVLLVIGLASVWVWQNSELQGRSDLRLYVGLQIFALLVTLIILLTPSPYDRPWDIAVVALFFGLARVFEIFDHQIYQLSASLLSGHTLKHLAAAIAGIWLIRMLAIRKKKELTG